MCTLCLECSFSRIWSSRPISTPMQISNHSVQHCLPYLDVPPESHGTQSWVTPCVKETSSSNAMTVQSSITKDTQIMAVSEAFATIIFLYRLNIRLWEWCSRPHLLHDFLSHGSSCVSKPLYCHYTRRFVLLHVVSLYFLGFESTNQAMSTLI